MQLNSLRTGWSMSVCNNDARASSTVCVAWHVLFRVWQAALSVTRLSQRCPGLVTSKLEKCGTAAYNHDHLHEAQPMQSKNPGRDAYVAQVLGVEFGSYLMVATTQ